MVLAKFARIVTGTAIFLMLSAIFSCEELIFVDCAGCLNIEPEDAALDIKLSKNQNGALITVYEGTPENNIIFDQFISFRTSETLRVLLNKSYTLTAEYESGERTDIAVNSARPRVKFEEERCDDPCYFIYNTRVDLTLKNSR